MIISFLSRFQTDGYVDHLTSVPTLGNRVKIKSTVQLYSINSFQNREIRNELVLARAIAINHSQRLRSMIHDRFNNERHTMNTLMKNSLPYMV
jgi:hypothetical protein